MSNYRRIISYIYAYENGVKGKNIGFAKLETRNGQCRIQVNVKRIYVGGSDPGVYLLTTSGEVLLGKMYIRSGAGEFRTMVPSEHIGEQDLSMDQCYGLSIHDATDGWQSYTTIWEDAIAHAAVEDLADVSSESRNGQAALSTGTGPEMVFQAALEDDAKTTKEMPEPAKDVAMATPEAAAPPSEEASIVEEEVVEATGEGGIAEAEIPQHTASNRSTSGQTGHPSVEIDVDVVPDTAAAPQDMELQEAPAAKANPGDSSGASCSQEDNATVQPKKTEQDLPPLGSREDLLRLQRLEAEAQSHKTLWSRIRKARPKIRPFDYDGGCEVLTINPQDIGLLPMEMWNYGNNSFVLHGYYNYRHLILARIHNPDGTDRYLLGVPGHYYDNERHIASMFGFPNFVLSNTQPYQNERFGYWYTDIRLGN